jgi:PTH2 family peptidyl-tRNA hydrolase
MKQVIIIRKDLKMRKGKMIAQGAHASVMVALKYIWHAYVWLWMFSNFTKVVVSVNSKDELLGIYHKAKKAGLPCALILDIGKTEFHGTATYTAVAVGPAPHADVDRITSKLVLL